MPLIQTVCIHEKNFRKCAYGKTKSPTKQLNKVNFYTILMSFSVLQCQKRYSGGAVGASTTIVPGLVVVQTCKPGYSYGIQVILTEKQNLLSEMADFFHQLMKLHMSCSQRTWSEKFLLPKDKHYLYAMTQSCSSEALASQMILLFIACLCILHNVLHPLFLF